MQWVGTNLPIAIQSAADFWNNTLLPALTAIWEFINTYLVPLFTALAGVVLAAVSKALEAVALVWQNTLSPALSDLWSFVSTQLQPIMQGLADFFNNVLAPAFQNFTTQAVDKLSQSLDSVVGWIQEVTSWLEELKKKIGGIDLGPLQPGSPTPFEIGLRGAASAAAALAGEMATLEQAAAAALVPFAGMTAGSVTMATAAPQMSTAAPAVPALGAVPGRAGATTNNSVTVNANYARYQEPPALVQDFNLAMALL